MKRKILGLILALGILLTMSGVWTTHQFIEDGPKITSLENLI